MIKYKTYKYLIKPTNSQKEIIKKNLEACTLVFNKFVAENGLETYKLLKAKDILGKYKREEISLMNVDSSALFNLIINLQDRRYNTHPAKTKKYSVTSYTTSNLSGVYGIYIINSEYVQIPKLGSIKTVMHRQIPSNYSIQKASISIDNIGNYYVCIYCSYESNSKAYLDINNSIGLDTLIDKKVK